MFTRLLRFAPFAAALAVAAISVPAQAGVSWSVGINAPIAPGVHVGTVINGGHAPRHHHYHRPPPVYYAPPPVYLPPPVVYMPPRPAYVAPVVYAPRPVYVAPRPYHYRPPVIVRPGHGHHHHHPHHPYQPQGNPTRGGGGYGPVASVR